MTRTLADTVAGADVLLYDFDGPLCDVFSGYPARRVARDIERLAGREFNTDDPLKILEHCDGSEVLRVVEDALISAEVSAASSANATPGGVESVRAALAAHRRVGVVSNNSSAAVEHFLTRVGLRGVVWPIIGRSYLVPSRMKPHPWPLSAALDALDVAPDRTLFVGDSGTDIEAACGAGVPCLAFANKPGKKDAFMLTSAVVIENMWELHKALASRSPHAGGLSGSTERSPG